VNQARSAVMIGTGARKARLGQENQRCGHCQTKLAAG